MRVNINSIVIALLCLYAVFGVATQTRIGGTPLGVGELVLMALISIFFVHGVLKNTLRTSLFYPNPIMLCMIIICMCGLLGSFVNSILGYYSEPFHDAISLTLSFIFVLLLSSYLCSQYEIASMLKKITVFFTLFYFLFFALSFFVPSILGFEFWYGVVRFRGLSENPNQLALALSMIPFLLLALYQEGEIKKRILFICFIALIVLSVFTLSDALMLSLLSGGFFYFLITLAIVKKLTLSKVFVRVFFVCIVMVVVGFSLILFQVEIINYVEGVYSDGGQGGVRVRLWMHAMEAGADGLFLGLGPGAHSGYKAPHLAYESHNTFFDMFASYGILGVSSLLFLMIHLILKTVKTSPAISAAIVSFCVFSMFHFTIRQPLVWMLLVFIYYYSLRIEKRSAKCAA